MLNRRLLLAGALLPWVAPAAGAVPGFAALEQRAGGRVGVAALDSGGGAPLGWRAHERFPMCSTFKLLAVAALLARVDAAQDTLARWIPYGEADLLEYAPITRARRNEGGLTLGTLCEAAIRYSDNSAANLLLEALGGPPGVTAFARSLGDRITRLDRTEPQLNEALPGDVRDTTSPAAMLGDLQQLLVNEVLSAAARARLTGWLCSSQVGAQLIRAGLPAHWSAGTKSGHGAHGAANDVAIIFPPQRAPLLLSIYTHGARSSDSARDAVVAEAARLACAQLTPH